MSFFGFNTTLPPRAVQEKAPFTSPANLGEVDFEDTFDGFDDRLDDSKDAANDDTFGGDTFDSGPVDNQYDFFGRTAQIARALELGKHEAAKPDSKTPAASQENNPNISHRGPVSAAPKIKFLVGSSKPFKTGYEQYSIPDLVVDKDIWGYSPPQPKAAPAQIGKEATVSAASHSLPAGRKVMSLEEVEASMKHVTLTTSVSVQTLQTIPAHTPSQVHNPAQATAQMPLATLPEPRTFPPGPSMPYPDGRTFPANGVPPHQFPEPRPYAGLPPGVPPMMPPGYPFPDARAFAQGLPPPGVHHPGLVPGPCPPQVDPAVLLATAEKRNRRIQKIQAMSKDNGLMTPHDKNYITRIQLQQLVTAVGSLEKNASENTFLEDFYYQVFSMIRGGKGPANFAQAYAGQASNRYGHVQNASFADTHIQRMQQQVARAIEAAKTRPKMTQLAIEGSLGTISFSNSKTPKPLLKVRANKGGAESRPRSSGASKNGAVPASNSNQADGPSNYRTTLLDLERLAMLLLAIEDHKRQAPALGMNGPSPDLMDAQTAWKEEMDSLNKRLWECTRVKGVPTPGSQTFQPFIMMLCHTKGKRMVQRIFNHADNDLRVTILTLVVLHLHVLPTIMNTSSPNSQRDHIAPFMTSVIPPIFAQIGESSLDTISTLLENSVRINIPMAVSTRPGKEIFTMLISRAELLHESAGVDGPNGVVASDVSRARYRETFNQFFSALESTLPTLFTSLSKADREDDLHVWQFLAAIGVASDQQSKQQERLVLGVKDAVLEAVRVSRSPETPPEVGAKIVAKVNLFMKSLGLDVEQLG